MEKYLKYLMLLFVAALSVSFTACGDDDDEPDTTMEKFLNTVTVGRAYEGSHYFESVMVDDGCQIYHNPQNNVYGNVISVAGGKIVYVSDLQNFMGVITVPIFSLEYSSHAQFYNGGCYIIHSNTGDYIYLKVVKATKSSETYQFQKITHINP